MQVPDIVHRWEEAIRQSLSPSNSSTEEQLGFTFSDDMTIDEMVQARFDGMLDHCHRVMFTSNK